MKRHSRGGQRALRLLRVEARPPSIKESGRPRPEYAGRGAYLAGRRSIVTVEILPVKGNGDL